MKHVAVEEVERWMGPAAVKRPLGKALGTTDMAVNYYELDPGDSFAFGYHKHAAQEEVFYVQSGTVTFETEDGPVTVGPSEAIRFAPGEYQQGVNEGDEAVVALALGAPGETGGSEILRACEDCGERTPHRLERAGDDDAIETVCEACGAVNGRYT